MKHGVIVVQSGAIEKEGEIHIPSHWYYILKAYGEVFPGTRVVCRLDKKLKDLPTKQIPSGLVPVLLDRMDTQKLSSLFSGYLSARRRIFDLVEKASFVGAVIPSNLGNLACAAAMKFNKSFFVEMAGENLFYEKRLSLNLPFKYLSFFYTRQLDRKIIRSADLMIFVSHYLVEKSGRLPKPCTVIPHTTISDLDIFPRTDTCQGSEIKIFSANRIVREKGLQNLLSAIKRLRDDGYNIVATLAGDGDYLSELKSLCTKLELDPYIQFPGHINVGDELWEYYRHADIMVLPTIASGEGTPKCIIEAMASSCPVIASCVGGIKTIFDESLSGILVKPGNDWELVTAIKTLVQNKEVRETYIKNGLEWAKKVTLEKRVLNIQRAFKQYLPSIISE
jgi:glycosyltransferase involved in cell wall biosynthesis